MSMPGSWFRSSGVSVNLGGRSLSLLPSSRELHLWSLCQPLLLWKPLLLCSPSYRHVDSEHHEQKHQGSEKSTEMSEEKQNQAWKGNCRFWKAQLEGCHSAVWNRSDQETELLCSRTVSSSWFFGRSISWGEMKKGEFYKLNSLLMYLLAIKLSADNRGGCFVFLDRRQDMI